MDESRDLYEGQDSPLDIVPSDSHKAPVGLCRGCAGIMFVYFIHNDIMNK